MSLRRLLCAATLVLAGFPAAASAEFSSTPDNVVGTDGSVHAIAIGSDGRTYLGGSFSTVGPVVGAGIGFDDTLTSRNTGLAGVSGGSGNTEINGGQILDTVPDGSGGWYIGGTFGVVGGAVRNNLAHILPDGRVDPNFDPEPDGPVQYLALSDSTLYFTGKFANVGSTARAGSAAVSTANGALTGWNPNPNYTDSMCGLQAFGGTIFICDSFSTQIGGGTYRGFAEVDGGSGSLIWAPATTFSSFDVSSTGILYAFGNFTATDAWGARYSYELGAYQLPAGGGTPTLLPLQLNFQNDHGCCSYPVSVSSMIQIGATLYLGGAFTEVDVPEPTQANQYTFTAYARGNGAALGVSNIASAEPTVLPWDPQANTNINSLTVAGNGDVVVGGNFSSAGGATRGHLAVVDPSTGDIVAGSSDPEIDGNVNTVAGAGSAVYAGGAFSIVHGSSRSNLAILNADSTVSALNPSVDGEVDALALSGSALYAGGQFRNATGAGATGATGRSYLADFSTANGSLGTFDPEPDAAVSALATNGTNLYAGGSFGHLNSGNTTHGDLAAFKLVDGSLVSGFDPAPNGGVSALAIGGSRLYAGGGFSKLTGETGSPARSDVAAFDLPSLGLDAFSPPAFDRAVNALAANATTVYAGGDFDNVGSTYQPRLAALDGATGALTAWNPSVGGDVFSLALDGSTLYAGGSFTYAGGVHESGAAGLDTTTGAATSFAPDTDYSVEAIADAGGHLALGGTFQQAGGVVSPGFAEFGTGGGGTTTGGGPTTLPPGGAGLAPEPTTVITAGPDYFTAARQVSFAFASSAAGAGFQCSLDSGQFSACSSPYTTPELGYGPHTFLVRSIAPSGAIDAGGASESFVVETPQALTTSIVPGAPMLSNVSVTRRITLVASLRGKKAPGFHLRLSTAGTVTISLARRSHGRWIVAGQISPVRERAGSRFIAFSGNVVGGELIAGRYRATITAYSATGIASRPAIASFSLVKPKAAKRRSRR
jgi:hypothetical protein